MRLRAYYPKPFSPSRPEMPAAKRIDGQWLMKLSRKVALLLVDILCLPLVGSSRFWNLNYSHTAVFCLVTRHQ